MDIESAKAFKARLEAVVAELSTALLIAQRGCSADAFPGVRKSIGHLIADVDALLHESIYADHPEVDHLRGQG
jgi:hypothetical protein